MKTTPPALASLTVRFDATGVTFHLNGRRCRVSKRNGAVRYALPTGKRRRLAAAP